MKRKLIIIGPILGIILFFAGYNYGQYCTRNNEMQLERELVNESSNFITSNSYGESLPFLVNAICINKHYDITCGAYGGYLERSGRPCDAVMWYEAVLNNYDNYSVKPIDREERKLMIKRAKKNCKEMNMVSHNTP